MYVYLLFTSLTVLCIVNGEPECDLDLKTTNKQTHVILDILKWTKPKSSLTKVSNGDNVDLQCDNGFIQDQLQSKQYTFQCNNGLYNKTFQYTDLLCKSDFHKNDFVEAASSTQISSKILKCDGPNTVVYKVKVINNDQITHVYTVCFDKAMMRPKFAFKPRSNTLTKYSIREPDVWGFDGFGSTTNEKISLSRGYVKNSQQNRVTDSFKEKYNQGKTYPYYFNRGHLVPYADFIDEIDKKSTSNYINAAPQWELLNKNQWSLVEREVRDLLKTDTIQWEVYTGTYGSIPTTRGPLTLAPIFDNQGRFKKGYLPVPMLFWKIAHHKSNNLLTRVFVGVNNPEIRTSADIVNQYRICEPLTGSVKGSEFFGFTYECNLEQFLTKLRSENIVR